MKTIQLQEVGTVAAKQAGDLEVGDVTVWNFGSKGTIVGVEKETAKFITYSIDHDGTVYSRRLKKDRLVGVQ